MWSEQREQERPAVVGRWLDTACERADLADGSLMGYRAFRARGELSEAIVALIEVGNQAARSAAFWEAIQQAAKLMWLEHPWSTSNEEYTLRMQYLVGLRSRITGWDA